jgi:hypothetical protein
MQLGTHSIFQNLRSGPVRHAESRIAEIQCAYIIHAVDSFNEGGTITAGFFGAFAIPEIPGTAAAVFDHRAVVACSPFSKRGAKLRWSLSAR